MILITGATGTTGREVVGELRRLGAEGVRALVRDPARAEFWRYLRRAVAHHRRNFAHAMTLAAMGYHFRKLTESSE